MYTIYIIDDNINSINEVENTISNCSNRFKHFRIESILRINNQFVDFKNKHSFNNSKNNIYFIDIKLNSSISGLDIAREIRKYDYLGNIIILTSYSDMAQTSYSYFLKAINFIEKNPLTYQMEIEDTIKQILKDNQLKSNSAIYTFKSHDSLRSAPIDSILYFETAHKKRYLTLHTFSETYICNGTIKKLEETLPSYFVRCHKSFILNTQNIDEICVSSKPFQAIFINGKSCDISKRFVPNPIDLLHYKKK